MLSTSRRASLAARANQTLTDTCRIITYTETKNGFNHVTRTPSYSAVIPCRVFELGSQRGNRDAEIGGAMASIGDYTVRLPLGTVVSEANAIEVTTSSRVRVLQVARIIEHSYATLLTVVCTETR